MLFVILEINYVRSFWNIQNFKWTLHPSYLLLQQTLMMGGVFTQNFGRFKNSLHNLFPKLQTTLWGTVKIYILCWKKLILHFLKKSLKGKLKIKCNSWWIKICKSGWIEKSKSVLEILHSPRIFLSLYFPMFIWLCWGSLSLRYSPLLEDILP